MDTKAVRNKNRALMQSQKTNKKPLKMEKKTLLPLYLVAKHASL